MSHQKPPMPGPKKVIPKVEKVDPYLKNRWQA